MTMVTAGKRETAIPEGDERLTYRGLGQRLLIRPEIVGMLAAVLIYYFFWGVSGPFGNAGGAATVLDVSATLGIMAVAVGVLMIGGEFDLSSGTMTGAMGIVIILLVKDVGELGGAGLSYWIAIPASLAIALGIGWLNGTMVERTGLPSFIVTLATFFVVRGLKLAGSKIIVDQIQVGRADEGQHYGFWNRILGSTWERGDHVWQARDSVYVVLCVIGAVLIAAAICELTYRRAQPLRPAGLPILGAGLAGAVVGVLLLRSLDGADWVPMVVLAASALVAAAGLGRWRYRSVPERGTITMESAIWWPLGVAAGCLALAIVAALSFDPYDDTDIVPFVTEQGLRAILFLGLAAVAVAFLAIATSRAGKVNVATRSALLALSSVLTFAMALFIQSESESHKFRTELFSHLCVVALLLLAWAVMASAFEQRRYEDAAADSLARRVALIGSILVVVGAAVRLLFSVQAEIDDPDNTAQLATFSIRIVWFLAFAAVLSWVLRKTAWGSWVYAVGGNKEAARQVGVPAHRTKVQLFMLVAFAAWLVGVLLAFRLNSIQAGTGNGEEFEYIIAAVVGGTMLTGGYGTPLGAAIGAFIMAMSQQGISFAGWNTDWRFVFLGGILLVAVSANGYVRKKAEAMR